MFLATDKGYSRASDLTIGDFWGIWDIAPEMDDHKGTSVVLVQSARGAELFDKISENLALKKVSLEEASGQNQAMLKSAARNARRQTALALIKDGRIATCETWFVEKKPSMGARAKNIIKRFIRKMTEES